MGKECKLINGKHSWVLNVDGQHIGFTGRWVAEYFAEHYEGLGYEIMWDESEWDK